MKVEEHPVLHGLVQRKESLNCTEQSLYHFDVMPIIALWKSHLLAQTERFF